MTGSHIWTGHPFLGLAGEHFAQFDRVGHHDGAAFFPEPAASGRVGAVDAARTGGDVPGVGCGMLRGVQCAGAPE